MNIRKMRITGLISLRGNGRFIDINTNENNKIDYILQTHKAFKGDYLNDTQTNKLAFFNYMAIVDSFLLVLLQSALMRALNQAN